MTLKPLHANDPCAECEERGDTQENGYCVYCDPDMKMPSIYPKQATRSNDETAHYRCEG